MTYRVRRLDLTARLRDMRELESAMQTADMNANQLAKASGVSRAYVGMMRRGQAGAVSEHMAVAIERALGCKRGALFSYGEP